jgi:DNA gyrase subunit A
VLLVEGSQGIAVGMATSVPPHNLGETVDATIHLIRNPQASIGDLMRFIKGPDFPTAGFIVGRNGIIEAYSKGRGSIKMRARTEIEDAGKGYQRIVVTEIPYMVNKAKTVEAVAELVKAKTITGIRDLRDESDRQGMRVVFDLKRDENPEVILNQLYRHTNLQTSFGVQLLCVDKGRPRQMNLRELLHGFIEFRKEVVVRRTQHELRRARERAHILEGLRIALENLDAVIAAIRESPNPPTAKQALMDKFGLSEVQAQAVLDMRLQRLTGLERDKILQELAEVLAKIAELEGILASEDKVLDIIVDELTHVRDQFADERRTEILDDEAEKMLEDFIAKEDMVVTFSGKGYVKRVAGGFYRAQLPGGKGRIAARVGAEDELSQIIYASTHDLLLCFSNRGRVYWMKAYQVPEETTYSKGKAIVNLIKIEPDERIKKILPTEELSSDGFIVMVSAKGKIKKTSVSEFSKMRSTGLIALTIDPDDELIDVNFTSGEDNILLATRKGKAIRFDETDVRPMGRQARGVTGIRMKPDDSVVAMQVISKTSGGTLLAITETGFGKRSPLDEYPMKGRGGQGVINIKTSAKSGDVVGIQIVDDSDHLLILTSGGRIVRLSMSAISAIGRNTQGRTFVRMNEGERVVDVVRAEAGDSDDGSEIAIIDEPLPEEEPDEEIEEELTDEPEEDVDPEAEPEE